MIRKKVWRYYCEYCKKSGCSGGHMKRHELACTMNPDRQCGVCKMTEETQHPMPELLACIESDTLVECEYDERKLVFDSTDAEDRAIAALEKLTNCCPACMLAAFRQSNVYASKFHYKASMESLWSEINSVQLQDEWR